MDPWIQIFGVVGQLLFYGGLLMLLCGLPLFIWLAVRACRDLHRIADALSSSDYERVDLPDGTRVHRRRGSAAAAGVVNSAFGR